MSDFRQSGENEICAPSKSGARRSPTASGAMAAYGAWGRARGWKTAASAALSPLRFVTKISGELSLGVKARADDGPALYGRCAMGLRLIEN